MRESRPVLGIETSCDETAAAVLAPDGAILAEAVHSQLAEHARFGGVVPEGAPRPDDVGWYFLPDGWLALGVDGNAHWCPAPEGVAAPTSDGQPEVGPTCAEAGRWAAREGGFQVGAEAYAWRSAGLVRVLP